MEFISSDTNVWIDFCTIDKLYLPFKLPYTYIMNNDAIEDELLNPKDLKEQLIQLGLKKVELDIDELFLAEEYGRKYKKLSIYDKIALAIAKNRHILLLTGDLNLRKAAQKESVEIIGTLGILDRLFEYNYITEAEFDECIRKLKDLNFVSNIRLPANELEERLTIKKKEEIRANFKVAV